MIIRSFCQMYKEKRVIILITDERAYPARKLYEKIGFKELPVRDGKYADRSY